MEDKYAYALLGVVLGSFLTATLTFFRELYANDKVKKEEAQYLSIRMVCIFDTYAEGCASVAGDNGLHLGQPDPNGSLSIQVEAPQLDIHLPDVNWKSLPSDLMYEILYFPNLIKNTESFVDGAFEQDFPPYDDGFAERQYQYAKLGLAASVLSEKLRMEYSVPKNHNPNWDIVGFMESKRDAIDKIRAKKASDHSILLASLKT